MSPNGTTWSRPAVLVAALLLVGACSDDGAASSEGSRPTASAPAPGATLFTDTFQDDHNDWALPENENSRTEVVRGDFVWEAKRAADLRPHLIAQPLGDAFDRGKLRMLNVVVRAVVTPERGAGAYGVFCREVRDTDSDFQWYEFVARDGYAAIRRADSAGHLEVLAKTTDVHLPLGHEATLEAACTDDAQGQARLWFSVNGEALLATTDPHALGNGVAGLQAYDAPDEDAGSRYLIRWHDFTVSRATA
jgi:hypothetical protein